MWLSIALRIFTVGDPLGIGLAHGESPSEVNFRTWRVVDAIHLEKIISIIFPVNYDEQGRVVNGFKAISTAEFDNSHGL